MVLKRGIGGVTLRSGKNGSAIAEYSFNEPNAEIYRKVKKNHHFLYEITETRMLEMMLAIDPELKEAYNLVQKYNYFNNTYENKLAGDPECLDILIDEFMTSDIPEMIVTAQTLFI